MGETLQDQWDAVRSAPLLYLAALLVLGGIIWWFIDLLYRHRTDTLKERVEALKDENTRLKSSERPSSPKPLEQQPQKERTVAAKPAQTPRAKPIPVPENVTPLFLRGLFAGKTEHQGSMLAAPYMGKLMRVTGSVNEVGRGFDRWSVAIQAAPTKRGEVILWFDEEARDKVAMLNLGDVVSAEGEIAALNDLWLQLHHCRLVD